jgi:RHS repeat-associated protein
VHGISPIGRSNNLLSGSGAYRTPEDAISSSSIEYDELGQVIGRRGQNGQYIRYRYDANGNVIKIIDSQNKETLLGYDARNRRIKMTDAKGGVTAMTYDVGDRLKQVTDPRGKVTTFVNDGFGDLWETSSPDAGTTRYSYDVLGNPSLMVRNGIQTIYEHDGLGRLKLVTAAGSSLHYLYDGCANGKGLLCQISGSTGSVSYTYTPEGLPATQTNVMPDGGSASVGHSYDGLGRLTGISYPDGTSVGYGYTAGRPTTMTVTVAGTTTTVVSDARYLPFSGPAGWSYGNGLNRTYSYDGDRRIVGVATGTATGIWQSLTYAYDNLNRIIAITNGVNADLTHGFGYDELSRITSVQTAGVTHAFEYDANGNRTVEVRNGVSSNYEISPEGNRLLGVAGGTPKSFSYDLVGNVVNDGSNSYTYDSFNRMTSVLANGTLTNYVLNGLGERIYKETAGVKQWFVYGPMNSLLAEHKSGQGWSSYAYFNGEPVAMIRGGVVNYIHGDYLGRPEIVTNGTRTVIWRAENAAFGRTVTIDAIGGLNIGFPGQYHDAETGNWNNGYRDYDDRLGRYIQSDPIGLDGGMNTYVYAGGNPISFVDPLGLQATVGPGIPVGGMPRASDACTDAALADSILNLTPGIGAIKAFSEEPNSLDTMSGVMSTTTVMTEVGTRRADAASNARLQDLERWGRNRREQTALRTSIQANSGLNKFLRGIGRNLGILSLGIEAAKFSEAAEKCWCKARGK